MHKMVKSLGARERERGIEWPDDGTFVPVAVLNVKTSRSENKKNTQTHIQSL